MPLHEGTAVILSVWLWAAAAQQRRQRLGALKDAPRDCAVCFEPFEPFAPAAARCGHCGSPELACGRCLRAWSRAAGVERRCVVCRHDRAGPRPALRPSASLLYVALAFFYHFWCHYAWLVLCARNLDVLF